MKYNTYNTLLLIYQTEILIFILLKRGEFTMNNLQELTSYYLSHCEHQKVLNSKTLYAYQIDLRQFTNQIPVSMIQEVNSNILENYISKLHKQYKPKTAKRKIASIKAFFHFLEYKEIIAINPFNKIQIKFREPQTLPKTIPLSVVEQLLHTAYQQRISAVTPYQRRNALRDASILELLFASGMRISELCSLSTKDVNLDEKTILIYGKGAKERKIQIENKEVIQTLKEYQQDYHQEIQKSDHFFVNQKGHPFSDQSVRRMISKYTALSGINMHITPHMFRHTFATSLLESDVDIRYIQEMLGHSSITITEIYTHVATAKQRDILRTKHPRNHFKIS